MASKREIMLSLAKGVSWNETAASLGCSKATVAKCAARMREAGLCRDALESMTDAEVSGLFADGRSKRGEESTWSPTTAADPVTGGRRPQGLRPAPQAPPRLRGGEGARKHDRPQGGSHQRDDPEGTR